VNDVLPDVGGYWGHAAVAGVFTVGLSASSSYASSSGGARAVRLLAA
jgi:hypothetical protein